MEAVRKVNPDVEILTGAGIQSGECVKIALELGDERGPPCLQRRQGEGTDRGLAGPRLDVVRAFFSGKIPPAFLFWRSGETRDYLVFFKNRTILPLLSDWCIHSRNGS